MRSMYVASVLAVISIFGACEAVPLAAGQGRDNENRVEELEGKLRAAGGGGGDGRTSRQLLQWFQPGPMGVKRAEQSGYIRFGKRSFESALKDGAGNAELSDLLSGYRPRRTSQSSYIRFGKRAGQLTYDNECIANAVKRARSLSQFHDLLLSGGCFKIQKREATKKDGFVRFGKRASIPELRPDVYDDGDDADADVEA